MPPSPSTDSTRYLSPTTSPAITRASRFGGRTMASVVDEYGLLGSRMRRGRECNARAARVNEQIRRRDVIGLGALRSHGLDRLPEPSASAGVTHIVTLLRPRGGSVTG